MGTQLGTSKEGGQIKANGCCTPKEDKAPQKVAVAPLRVLPIIFLPGIMGSNLRLKPKRQAELRKSNNIAWRPDRKPEAADIINASRRERQLQLDPEQTEVDTYDPHKSITGDSSETSEQRHTVEFSKGFKVGINTVLLSDDPVGAANPRTREMKARERGWGEIYYGSYQNILETCEQQLNSPSDQTSLDSIFGKDPALWGAHPSCPLQPLTAEQYRKAVEGCWFPVHAMGYNWLESNGKSARKIRDRILELISRYNSQKYKCEKVIIVTHSMGGLLARALIHPDIGGMDSKVLGIVHGVMPAIGAPAAYRRMRCGTESGGALDPANLVLGAFGSLVTAVLGNAQGGLELLPSKAYGNGWLEIRQNGMVLKKLPQHSDPYREIYQLKDSWFRLFREEWLNPAGLDTSSFQHSCELLEAVKDFHEQINDTYHNNSYAHYGADPTRSSWEKVTWELDPSYKGKWEKLRIFSDQKDGGLRLFESDSDVVEPEDGSAASTNGGEPEIIPSAVSFSLKIGKSSGAGDQTVPLRSADQQLLSKKFTGVFRQVGYEHQKSYMNPAAVNSTLYSLIRIAEKMEWSADA